MVAPNETSKEPGSSDPHDVRYCARLDSGMVFCSVLLSRLTRTGGDRSSFPCAFSETPLYTFQEVKKYLVESIQIFRHGAHPALNWHRSLFRKVFTFAIHWKIRQPPISGIYLKHFRGNNKSKRMLAVYNNILVYLSWRISFFGREKGPAAF